MGQPETAYKQIVVTFFRGCDGFCWNTQQMQVDAKKKVVVDYEGWRCVSDCVNFNESGTVLLLANCGYEEEVSCGRGEDGKEGRE